MSSSRAPGRLHILCFGNPLHGDDGFGPAVSMALRRQPLPESVKVFDCETRGLDVLGLFEDCDEVVLVDAMAGEPAGRVRCLTPDEVPAEPVSSGGHGAGVGYLLASLREMIEMPPTTVVAAEIGEVKTFSPGLSLPLAAAVWEAADLIRQRWLPQVSVGGGELAEELDVLREANRALEVELIANAETFETLMSEQEQQQDELQRRTREIGRLQGAIERAFATMTEILIVLGVDGRVSRVSSMLERDLGFSPKSVIGGYFEQVFAEDALAILQLMLPESEVRKGDALLFRAIRSCGGPFEAELNLRRASEHPGEPGSVPYLVRGNLLHSSAGKLEGAVVVATNIFGLKARESALQDSQRRLRETAAELAEHRDNLAGLVEVQTHDLRLAKEMAEAASRAKSDFLSNMSHEVRTPLNAILGMSELCLHTGLNEQQANYLTKIRRAADHLLGIINDILDFSRIEAGKLAMESVPFDMPDLVDEVVQLLIARVEEKGLKFCVDLPEEAAHRFIGDPLRLRQVVINLLGNAIKFSESGCIVLGVRVEPDADAMATVHFFVSDEGIGIPREQQDVLFSAFSQADSSTTRRFGGSGLGLAISKRLVEHMGGRIWVESGVGRGSTFHFTARLGMSADSPSASSQLSCRLKGASGRSVLVLDEHPKVAALLAGQCRQLGLQAIACTSVAAANEAMAAESASLFVALVDASFDGQAALGALPVVRLVTHGEATGGAADGRHLLGKPCSLRELCAALAVASGAERPAAPIPAVAPMDFSVVAHLQGMDVLVVDDVDLNQELMSDLLGSAGFSVRVASNGREAIDAVREQRPAAILMDCQMPVMDGFEATRQLRALPEYRDLPIIALTAGVLSHDRQACFDAGMNAHVAKPVDLDALLRVIARLVVLPKSGPSRVVAPPISPPVAPPVAAPVSQATAVATPETGESLPELPGVNVVAGLTLVNNKVAFYRRMLAKFGRLYGPNFGTDINAALTAGDMPLAIRLAHTLKGSSRNLGIETLGECAASVEAELKDPAGARPPASLPALLAEVMRVHHMLKDLA